MLYYNKDNDVIVSLYEENSMFGYEDNTILVPATDVAFSEITVMYWHTGLATIQTLSITEVDWFEIDYGVYVLKIHKELLQFVGKLYIRISGPTVRDFKKELNVTHAPYTFIQPELCAVTGNIVDLTGDPDCYTEEIMYRVVGGVNFHKNSFINNKLKTTTTDNYGNFVLPLIKGVDVFIELRSSGVKKTVRIPNLSTVNLKDLIS